jgi:CubicO group peptidase (beta-lactamase class C family)
LTFTTVLTLRTIIVALLVSLFFGQQPAAQGLTFALFARYVEALRQQAGIPGLAVSIVRNGQIVDEWQRGFGVARVEGAVPVTPDTPFSLGDVSQTIAATLVLRHCIDRGEAELDDQVRRWSPSFPEANTTFAQLLAHNGTGGYRYIRNRYQWLTAAAEECGDRPYARLVDEDIAQQLGMINTVPGGDVAERGSDVRKIFPVPMLTRFEGILQQIAVPYRLEGTRRVISADYRVPRLDASSGLVASVRDLASFEAALDTTRLLQRETRAQAWVARGGGPMGYGWFVQDVSGKKAVWRFGLERNAYSSLVIKVPGDGLTLILLANSDALTAPFERQLEDGDVTVSPFARIFFSLLG